MRIDVESEWIRRWRVSCTEDPMGWVGSCMTWLMKEMTSSVGVRSVEESHSLSWGEARKQDRE
jgi:hypothetical protein